MLSLKSIESFIIAAIMSYRGYSNTNNYQTYSNKETLNLPVEKMYSIDALTIWMFSLSFMFPLPKRSV